MLTYARHGVNDSLEALEGGEGTTSPLMPEKAGTQVPRAGGIPASAGTSGEVLGRQTAEIAGQTEPVDRFRLAAPQPGRRRP
jgi:hypothetical protein